MPARLSFFTSRCQQTCTGSSPVQALNKTFARKVFKSCPFERMLSMTVDFGIRLPRYPDDPTEDTHAFYERTLNSLSEHITTVWLSDHLQKGDSPNFESWV